MSNHKPTTKYLRMTKSFLFGLALLSVTFSSFAEFTQFDASYSVRFDKFKAKSAMSLRQDPETGEYTYTTYTKPRGLAKLFGNISEALVFDLNKTVITPKSYRHDSRDDVSIDYDWSENEASSITEDDSEVLTLDGSELDLLSLQMQLSRDLKNNLLKPNYKVIKDNSITAYKVVKLGEDTFKLADETYKTIKVQQKREGSSRRTVLHFAPELDYILVKMLQFKGDEQRGSFNLYAYKNLGVAIEAPEPEDTFKKKNSQ